MRIEAKKMGAIRRTNVIRSVGRVFGAARLGSGRGGSFGPFWFITRKILDLNCWRKRVLCRTLEMSQQQARATATTK